MGKFGPVDERQGTPLYPGFYRTTPPGFTRIQRLETGSQRLQRGSLRPTSGNYARIPGALLTGKTQEQALNLTSSGVKKLGGVPPFGAAGQFAYTSTTTTITWYWDGTNSSVPFVITRADGSKFTVPTFGSGLHITGLSANTTYYFLPFWDTDSLCNIGWVEGTVGTPQIAFVLADTNNPLTTQTYLIEQSTQTREPLSAGFMTATTTSGGSGGGGAGGGGAGGGCVRSGTKITVLGDMEYQCEVLEESNWIYLETEQGKELFCTYDHPLYHALNGKVEADTLCEGDPVITDQGEQKLVTAQEYTKKCSKYIIRMAKGHLFFANGFLSHNKFFPP